MASGPISSTSGPANTSAQSPQPSWEGDKMFNIYIYDYCNKRGFRETAQKLMVEADIAPDSAPPINAKQGLLFEWWSVFWVLFTAKSNGSGTDDAMLYVQQQRQTQQSRMHAQPQGMSRFVNGVPRQPGAMPPNGPMTNGVGPTSLQAAQGPMSNGIPGSMPFPMQGSGPQQNGIPGGVGGPSTAGSQQQPGFSMLAGQRPGGPQQRGPPNGAQFQSPTMAHASQNATAAPGQQPLMGQLGPSSHIPHLQRGGNMLPPNGAQGPQQAPNSSYQQQQQRPPSRTASPSNIMTQPSPSMAARQPPNNMSNAAHQDAVMMNELSKVPPAVLNSVKQELGFGDKDVQALSSDEKHSLLSTLRSKAGAPSGSNVVGSPSMQSLNQRSQQRQGAPQQQQQQRGNKRNSTSPADESETLPRNEASPPDRKRPRQSPLNAEQAPPVNYAQQPPQGAGGGSQQMLNGMMRPNMGPSGMNGFPPGGMQNMNPAINMPMGQSVGGPAMSNPMNSQQIPNREHAYRQSMLTLHKNNIPSGSLNNMMSGNAVSPTSVDLSSFNGNGSQGRGPQFAGNRMSQNRPMTMMPPVMGAGKDQSGQNKDKAGLSTSNNRPDASPRNQNPNPSQGTSNAGNSGQGTAPPTPNNAMTAPSPSAILSNMPTTMNPSAQSMVPDPNLMSLFGFDNPLQLDAFSDPNVLGSCDLEQEFGQWFTNNPEPDATGLDPK